jgi:hypothetical protein
MLLPFFGSESLDRNSVDNASCDSVAQSGINELLFFNAAFPCEQWSNNNSIKMASIAINGNNTVC